LASAFETLKVNPVTVTKFATEAFTCKAEPVVAMFVLSTQADAGVPEQVVWPCRVSALLIITEPAAHEVEAQEGTTTVSPAAAALIAVWTFALEQDAALTVADLKKSSVEAIELMDAFCCIGMVQV